MLPEQMAEKGVVRDDAVPDFVHEQGFRDAAHEAFKQALRSRSRDTAIRHLGLSERATNYAAQGKKGMARKDLERILAEDSTFDGVKERLAELSA
jgi:hypothetical protein